MSTYSVPKRWRRREVRSDRDVSRVLSYVSDTPEITLQNVSYELLNSNTGEVLWRGPFHNYEEGKAKIKKSDNNKPGGLKLYIKIDVDATSPPQ